MNTDIFQDADNFGNLGCDEHIGELSQIHQVIELNAGLGYVKQLKQP